MEEGARSYVLKNNIMMEQGEAIRIDISQLEEEILTKPILDPQTKENAQVMLQYSIIMIHINLVLV